MSRSLCVLFVAALVVALPALAQDPFGLGQDRAKPGGPDPSAESQGDDTALNEFDKLAKSLAKEKKKAERPPFEFPRSQVAPFDILPFVKPHHWSTLTIEARANKLDYNGLIRTTATDAGGRPQIPLLDLPRAMIYQRDALLLADQSSLRSMQIMLPTVSRRLFFELTRPGSIRPDALFDALTQRLEPHQMLIPVLGPEPSAYNVWTKMLATIPTGNRGDINEIDRVRYYRLVFPTDPTRPNLSPHPLTWTTISHLIWDGAQPEILSRGSFSQQQALADWLHWGGQLIIVASRASAAALEDSMIGPYLPAHATGESIELDTAGLQALSNAYPPPFSGEELIDFLEPALAIQARSGSPPRYRRAEPVSPAPGQPLYLARLEPKGNFGITATRLGDPAGPPIAVERRVGRGRIMMLAVNPNDPALVNWPGFDSWVRRAILRRPEERWVMGDKLRGYEPLPGTDLSWVRFVARDLGATPPNDGIDLNEVRLDSEFSQPRQPVAAWVDTSSDMPKLSRDTLERASGITIPGSQFVLRIMLVYIAALVPLNWLISRFIFKRREAAWIIAPLLALGFAYGVERAAAVDLGFEIACDEIDLVEIQGDYPRAHVSRFASLYSAGRVDFTVAQPNNPTALVLPMRSYQSLRGEEVRSSVFTSSGDPALSEFLVQPRSLAMFRAESMFDLGSGIEFNGDPINGRIVNRTPLEFRDAVLIDTATGRVAPLGNIAASPEAGALAEQGAHVVDLSGHEWFDGAAFESSVGASDEFNWAELPGYLDLLRKYRWATPAERGELRLVAWSPEPMPGQEIKPRVDRHRGVRLIVAHLSFQVPPDDLRAYFSPESTETNQRLLKNGNGPTP